MDFRKVFESIKRFLPVLGIGLAIIVFAVFINQGGRELIEGRLDYGLAHTKDDVRWQMYDDSLPLLRENPIWGIGSGNWARIYPTVMAPELAGINPVYLHSEPLQLWVELGSVGIAIVASLFLTILWRVICALRAVRATGLFSVGLRLRGVAAGLLAFSAATFVEFPLRVPAISVAMATCLGLLCVLVTLIEEATSVRDNTR